MILKEDFQRWKKDEVTRKLIELLNIGQSQATEDLIGMRGEVGDFPRGAITVYEEVKDYIQTGVGFYSEGEEE